MRAGQVATPYSDRGNGDDQGEQQDRGCHLEPAGKPGRERVPVDRGRHPPAADRAGWPVLAAMADAAAAWLWTLLATAVQATVPSTASPIEPPIC